MILHINTSKEWRGGENQTLELILGLQNKKVVQFLVCQPNSPLWERATNAGLNCIPLAMKSEFDFKAVKEIKKIISEKKIQIVHTHTSHAHSLAFFAKHKKDKWKLIVSRRVDFRIGKNIFSRWKYKSPLVDMFVTVSRFIREILIQDGIDPHKTIAIHSGIDMGRFKKLPSKEAARKELGLDKKEIVLGITAALVDHKDYPTLLKAISLVSSDIPFKLIILGDGPLKPNLQKLTTNLGIEDKVIFLGFKEDILPYLSLFNIFCLSSKEEGLGTSILDAFACGLPVVATRAGGIPEMVSDGEGGYLVEIGDSETFAKRIEELIQSESLRKGMGEYNKIKVKDFSKDNTIERTFQLYYSYLGKDVSKLGIHFFSESKSTPSIPQKKVSPKKKKYAKKN